ncbi:hypothetical protein [Acetobacter fallax]|uniref:Uncharacterized protein n=1 Tax=Acetobacter fallax TaxID=1737473 RepID=A0ABX0KBC5_9PROT|nr:hypothetical protein [Acetobacter fallax]NHO32158.1 hypothetical protein [Acetobacter fallax]NHO35789.1 hypothetical protein [Acetobacter fallax]
MIWERYFGFIFALNCSGFVLMSPPLSSRALYLYPWDLAEQADPAEFGAFARDLGLNDLTIAGAYHTGKFLRPQARGARVYFPEDGVVYTRADAKAFGRIRPLMSRLAAETDVFETYASVGLDVTAWMVLLHNTAQGVAHPEACCRNLFGDRYPYSLCPANPDVREYAIALCRDTSFRYPVKGLVIETPGWLPYQHGYHHEMALIGSTQWLDALLGLCFCESCQVSAREAGVDIEAVQRRLQGLVSGYLERPCDAPAGSGLSWLTLMLVRDDDFRSFVRWRCDVVTGLVAEIRAAMREDASLRVIPSVQADPALSWLEGSDFAAFSGVCDGLEVCLYDRDPAANISTALSVMEMAGGAEQFGGVLRPAGIDYASEGAFCGMVAALAELRPERIGFYNYGHLRRRNLEWIGAALAGVAA